MDPVAGQIIDLASGYVAYVDKEIAQIFQKEQSEIANANRIETRSMNRRISL